jgi:hypothetical protein
VALSGWQAEKAGVCVGDVLEGIEDVEFGAQPVALEWLIQLVRSLPMEVTLHLVHIDVIRPANDSQGGGSGR